MRLYDLVIRHSRLALQAVNVLREQFQQEPLLTQQIYEGVCDGGSELSRVQFLCKNIERERVVPKVVESEDCFGVG